MGAWLPRFPADLTHCTAEELSKLEQAAQRIQKRHPRSSAAWFEASRRLYYLMAENLRRHPRARVSKEV